MNILLAEEETGEEVHDRGPVGPLGILAMVVFWFLVWLTGPGFLTALYLGLVMGALVLIAKKTKSDFINLVDNNNWVFPAVVMMAIMSAVIAHFNPLGPNGPVEWLKGLLGSTPKGVGKHFIWGFFNKLFFGKAQTGGWSHAAVAYALWSIPGFAISYWDETKEFLVKLLAHKKGGEDGLWGFVRHNVFDLLQLPLKKFLGIDR